MATAPSAPPMEMSKPVPGQGSAPPFEPAKPYPGQGATEAKQGGEERSEMSRDEGEKGKGGGGGGEYGTFQGPPSYPPPRPPAVGYPQPVHPPGLFGQRYSRNPGVYHSGIAQDTEAGVRGYRNDRLCCCGLGIGWVLFILGFIFGAIPWYVGALLLCFYRRDRREKPGFIACAVAAVIGTILIIIAAVLPTKVRVHHY